MLLLAADSIFCMRLSLKLTWQLMPINSTLYADLGKPLRRHGMAIDHDLYIYRVLCEYLQRNSIEFKNKLISILLDTCTVSHERFRILIKFCLSDLRN